MTADAGQLSRAVTWSGLALEIWAKARQGLAQAQKEGTLGDHPRFGTTLCRWCIY